MTEYLPLLAAAILGLFTGFGIMAALDRLIGRLRGPSTEEREAVTNAPPRKRAVGAGSDLEWQVSLSRMYRELEALLPSGEER